MHLMFLLFPILLLLGKAFLKVAMLRSRVVNVPGDIDVLVVHSIKIHILIALLKLERSLVAKYPSP